MAFATQETRSRLPAIAGVTLVHVGLGYALLTGLVSADVITRYLPPLIVENIPLPTPPAPVPEPAKQRTETPSTERVLVPERTVEVQLPAAPDLTPAREPVIYVTPGPSLELPLKIDTPAPPQPSRALPARAKGNRANWITSDDYPSSALRAGEAGNVGIQVAVDVDGRVFACTVTASSGSAALDAATCRLYQKRARFTPARDDQGRAIVSTQNDRIRWQLPD